MNRVLTLLFLTALGAMGQSTGCYVTQQFYNSGGTNSTNAMEVSFYLSNAVYAPPIIVYSGEVDYWATNGYLAPAWIEAGDYNVQTGYTPDIFPIIVPADGAVHSLTALINTNLLWTNWASPEYLPRLGGAMEGNLTWNTTNFLGLVVNSFTTSQRTALAGTNGAIVYDSTLNQFFGWENGWELLTGNGGGSGNVAFDPALFDTNNGAVSLVLPSPLTNGLASQAWVLSLNYAGVTITNGLATTNWVLSLGYVTASVTNGLASTNWVLSQNYVTSAVTNGLASIGWVNAQGFVTSAVTNGLAAQTWTIANFQPLSAALTALSANNGSSLTSLNASQLSTGTVPLGVLPSAVVTNGGPLAVTNISGGVTNIIGLNGTNFQMWPGGTNVWFTNGYSYTSNGVVIASMTNGNVRASTLWTVGNIQANSGSVLIPQANTGVKGDVVIIYPVNPGFYWDSGVNYTNVVTNNNVGGVSVSGALTVGGTISGNGSGVTNVPGANIVGTVPGSSIPIDGSTITLNGSGKLQATGASSGNGIATNSVIIGPLTATTNSLLFEGDSYTTGTGATGTISNGFPWVIVSNLSITAPLGPMVNQAVGGTQTAEQSFIIYSNASFTTIPSLASNYTAVWLTGFNTMRLNGLSNQYCISQYSRELMAGALWLAMPVNARVYAPNSPGKVLSTGWGTNSAIYGPGFSSLYTTTSGATATFYPVGSAVYISTTICLSNYLASYPSGSFSVTIDGILATNFSTWSNACVPQIIQPNVSYWPNVLRFGGLLPTTHTVTVTVTSPTGQFVYVDYVVGTDFAREATYNPKVYIGSCCRMYSSSYSEYAPYNNGTDAAAFAYDQANQQVAATLAADGFSVCYVDVNSCFDPNAAGYISTADYVHPSNVGHNSIAVAFLQSIDQKAGAYEKSLAEFERQSIKGKSMGTVAIPASGTIPAPANFGGNGLLWNSNNCLYWVTANHTNYISGP